MLTSKDAKLWLRLRLKLRLCNRFHHPLLHMDVVSINPQVVGYLHNVNSKRLKQGKRDVLLMLGTVKCKGAPLTVLYDPGATVSFISKEAAHQLRLQGSEVTLSITKVGNINEVQKSKEYRVPLNDINGKCWEVLLYEIDEITTKAGKVNPEIFKSLFPNVKER